MSRIRVPWPCPGVRTARLLFAAGGAWSALFAVAHFYWAASGRIGVAREVSAITDRPAFLVYDIAAGVVFATAAGVGIALAWAHGNGRRQRAWLVRASAWGSVLCLLRGIGGLVQDVIIAAAGHSLHAGVVYDIWFVIAGVLFGSAARGLRSSSLPDGRKDMSRCINHE